MKIAYFRVSTEDQNPENQRKEVLSLLEGEGVVVFEENKSAFKDDFKRTEFNKILALIRAGKVKVFAVWDLDRIYRNRAKLKDFFELCRLKGVKVISFRQKWLSDLNTQNESINGLLQDIFLNFLGWLSEEESLKKSERVKIAYKNHKGQNWGRQKIKLNYVQVVLKYRELGSLRKTAEFFKVGKDTISKTLKSSEKSPLQKCNSFINEMAKKGSLTKEQLKDK